MPVSKLPKKSLYPYFMIVVSYIIYTKSILLNLSKNSVLIYPITCSNYLMRCDYLCCSIQILFWIRSKAEYGVFIEDSVLSKNLHDYGQKYILTYNNDIFEHLTKIASWSLRSASNDAINVSLWASRLTYLLKIILLNLKLLKWFFRLLHIETHSWCNYYKYLFIWHNRHQLACLDERNVKGQNSCKDNNRMQSIDRLLMLKTWTINPL